MSPIEIASLLSFPFLAIAMALGLYRLLLGPNTLDRLLGFDAIAISVMGASVVLSCVWSTDLYLELILIFGLLGFVSTVGIVAYLRKRNKTTTAPQANPEASITS